MNTRTHRLLILCCTFWACACGKEEPTNVAGIPLWERLRGTEWVESSEDPGIYEDKELFFQCNDTLRLIHTSYDTVYYSYAYPEKWLHGYLLWLGRADAPGVTHLPWYVTLLDNDTVLEIRGQAHWRVPGASGLELRGRYTLRRREDCSR